MRRRDFLRNTIAAALMAAFVPAALAAVGKGRLSWRPNEMGGYDGWDPDFDHRVAEVHLHGTAWVAHYANPYGAPMLWCGIPEYVGKLKVGTLVRVFHTTYPSREVAIAKLEAHWAVVHAGWVANGSPRYELVVQPMKALSSLIFHWDWNYAKDAR